MTEERREAGKSIYIKVEVDTAEAEKAVGQLEQRFDRLIEKSNRLLTALADAEKAVGSTEN